MKTGNFYNILSNYNTNNLDNIKSLVIEPYQIRAKNCKALRILSDHSKFDIIKWIIIEFKLIKSDCTVGNNKIINDAISYELADIKFIKWYDNEFNIKKDDIVNHNILCAFFNGNINIIEWLLQKFNCQIEDILNKDDINEIFCSRVTAISDSRIGSKWIFDHCLLDSELLKKHFDCPREMIILMNGCDYCVDLLYTYDVLEELLNKYKDDFNNNWDSNIGKLSENILSKLEKKKSESKMIKHKIKK